MKNKQTIIFLLALGMCCSIGLYIFVLNNKQRQQQQLLNSSRKKLNIFAIYFHAGLIGDYKLVWKHLESEMNVELNFVKSSLAPYCQV